MWAAYFGIALAGFALLYGVVVAIPVGHADWVAVARVLGIAALAVGVVGLAREIVRIVDVSGRLLAMAQQRGDRLQPKVVLPRD